MCDKKLYEIRYDYEVDERFYNDTSIGIMLAKDLIYKYDNKYYVKRNDILSLENYYNPNMRYSLVKLYTGQEIFVK